MLTSYQNYHQMCGSRGTLEIPWKAGDVNRDFVVYKRAFGNKCPIQVNHFIILSVELWRSRFDIYMPYPFVLDMPMELGLKLMASVCSYRMNAEGEFLNHIINKLNGILLIVMRVNFHRPDPGGIINRCVLKASDSIARNTNIFSGAILEEEVPDWIGRRRLCCGGCKTLGTYQLEAHFAIGRLSFDLGMEFRLC